MLIRTTDGPPPHLLALYELGQTVKAASDAVPSYDLSGMLQLSPSGWLLLNVPNALVRGVYDALDETGLELPSDDDGKLNAHISVMRPEELAMIGGADKVSERGKHFRYSIGRLVTVEPNGWPGVSKCWMLRVHSPELQALRRSYALSSLPNEGKFDFHVTVALRRRGVLGRNDVRKGS